MALIRQAPKEASVAVKSGYTGPTYTPDTIDHFVTYEDRNLPWDAMGHKLTGTEAEGLLTAEAALDAVGLNVTMEKLPIRIPDLDMDVKGTYAVAYRDADGTPNFMGTVQSRYQIIQPRDGLAFLDKVLEDVDGAHYRSVWTMRQKRQIGVTVQFPETVVVDPLGAADVLEIFGLGVNSFDGSTAYQFAATTGRLGCMNAFFPRLRTAQRSYCLKHTNGATASMAEAQRAIGITYNYARGIDAVATWLHQQDETQREFDLLLKSLFPVDPDSTKIVQVRNQDRQDLVRSIYETSATVGNITGTKWGAFNAVTEYAEWGRKVNGKTPEEKVVNRAAGTMDGAITRLTTAAFNLLTADFPTQELVMA